MRPTTAVSLLAVALLLSRACADEPTLRTAPAAHGATWTAVVSGHGVTREDAEQMALEEARDRVAAYLHQREPSLRWMPTVDDLRRWNMIQDIRHRDNQPSARLGPHPEVDVTVTVSDRAFQEILRRDRHLLAAKLLAALVALLALAAGYFRLEELTRGYYTGTLRVLALLGVGLVGAGLWLIF